MGWLAKYQPQLLSVLRIVCGLLFLDHGLQKLFGFPPLTAELKYAMANGMGPILLAAGAIELVGGILLTLGLFTRLTAFVCSGEMAIAYWIGHVGRTHSLFPALNGGDAAILYCFIFLFIAAAGPGPLALSRSGKI
ncbi:MAG: DoxX family protein [Proteobacteria bacterium]|nr:DoxX family protein [Pseudomonadota bacterium]